MQAVSSNWTVQTEDTPEVKYLMMPEGLPEDLCWKKVRLWVEGSFDGQGGW